MTQTDDKELKIFLLELREVVETEPDIALTLIDGAIKLLERKSTGPVTRTDERKQGSITPFPQRLKL